MSKKHTPNAKKGNDIPVAATEVKSTIPLANESALAESSLFKKAFYISLLLMLGIIWIAGYNVGYCSDEMDMTQYGKANISYYQSGGKDTSFLSLHQDGDTANAMRTLPYYGSNFEYIATGINYLTGQLNGRNEFNIRHVINQLIAIVGILFTGLCVARIKGYRSALFAAWLLFLTPYFFGWSLFDTKDVPFCAGYIASIYFLICFLEQLPRPSWRTALYLMLSLTFTIGIRVGGMLLFMYLFLFIVVYLVTKKKLLAETFDKANISRLLLQLVVVVVCTIVIVVICWPYVLRAPMSGLLESYGAAKKFPASIPMNFNGERISSTALPENYLLTYLFITIPVFILISIAAAVVLLSASYRSIKWRPTILVLFSAAFPLIYAIVAGVFLYNGWRHLLFMYPGFVAIAALGLDAFMERLKKPAFQAAFALVCLLGMLHPIIWNIKNNPYQYMYYNERLGFKNAYAEYESDVWGISVKPSIDWLMKNEKILEAKDTLVLLSNVPVFTRYYIKTNYPAAKLKIESASANKYKTRTYDYFIFNTLFLSTEYIQNSFPPEGTVHTEDVDGMPVTAVVRDTVKLQAACWQAVLHANYKVGDSLVNRYLATNKKFNPYMCGVIAMTRAMNGKYDDALTYGRRAIKVDNDDMIAHAALSFAYFKQNNLDGAIEHIRECLALAPDDAFVLQLADSIEAHIPR